MRINETLKKPMLEAKYLNVDNTDRYRPIIRLFYLNYEKFNAEVIKDIEINDHYGSLNQGNNEALLIEHTSINPNAEPHIGRCRNSLIGDFMSNLYGFTGYEVERHYFINDIGKKILKERLIQMIKEKNVGLTDSDYYKMMRPLLIEVAEVDNTVNTKMYREIIKIDK